jgi:hypothetical protein
MSNHHYTWNIVKSSKDHVCANFDIWNVFNKTADTYAKRHRASIELDAESTEGEPLLPNENGAYILINIKFAPT